MESNKETLVMFARGVSFIMIVLALFLIFITFFGSFKNKEDSHSNSNNFEIVDTYKGCSIIRWTNNQLAEYKYFLHCNNTRPVYEK